MDATILILEWKLGVLFVGHQTTVEAVGKGEASICWHRDPD